MTPRIAKPGTLDTSVQMVMRHGAGTPAANAFIATGLLESAVRAAYEVDGPLLVPEVDIAAAEAILARKHRGMVALSSTWPEAVSESHDVVVALPVPAKRRWKRAVRV